MSPTDRDLSSCAAGLPLSELQPRGAAHTAAEIAQQPEVWREVFAQVHAQRSALSAFMAPVLQRPGARVLLCGAGTSAFIGDCLQPALAQHLQVRVDAVPTTDLVAAPLHALQAGVPTLVVSFARSGSSPESVAAVALADRCLPGVRHLIVTCNAEGALYRSMRGRDDACVLLLPERCNDRAFAMTSSFTGMLLAAATAFGLPGLTALAVAQAAEAARALLRQRLPALQALRAQQPPGRLVYLGSGVLKGLAREAALKLLELSDGHTVAVSDSTMGFRHGPKTIVHRNTWVVVLVSSNPHVRAYDLDLLRELRADGHAGAVLAVGAAGADLPEQPDNWPVELPTALDDLLLALPMAVLVQGLALQQSLALGLTPDNPNASGAVTRVVHGVSIHPWPEGSTAPAAHAAQDAAGGGSPTDDAGRAATAGAHP